MHIIRKSVVAALVIAAISFAGCGGGKSSAAISMTTAKSGIVGLRLAGTGTTGTAVIDWGDGVLPETVTLLADTENLTFNRY